eukprot:Selendium_serpulae@DN5988_c1_g2_i10.p1
MVHYPDEPIYSERYADEVYEYRHVLLPKAMTREAQTILARRPQPLLSESEWRGLGVQQSRGWIHYINHKPEPHVLLFRRPLGTDPTTGKVHSQWKPAADARAAVANE